MFGHHRVVPLFVSSLILLISGAAKAQSSNSADSAAWATRRAELLERVDKDQEIREVFAAELRTSGMISDSTGYRMMAVDSGNIAWLEPMIAAHGWPSPASVGRDGIHAATLLVQHADQKPAFQAAVLPKLEAAYKTGGVDGEALALLTDRVAKAQGRPQRYGSQATLKGGRLVLDPIEDSAHVDDRRRSLGLPPLAVYMQLLDSMYGKRTQ